MQIKKKACKNQASQQKIGPSYFDRALLKLEFAQMCQKGQIA
jgi:hypothetical protein